MSGYTPAQAQAAILRLLQFTYGARDDVARDAGIAASGAGGALGAVTLVLRPGGTAGGNICTTWDEVMAAAPPVSALGIRSPWTLLLDDSIVSPIPSPEAGTFNVDNVTVQGVANYTTNSGGAAWSIGAGVAFEATVFRCIGAVQITYDSTTDLFTLGPNEELNVFLSESAFVISTAAGAFFSAKSAGAWYALIDDGCNIGDGDHPVFKTDTNASTYGNAFISGNSVIHAAWWSAGDGALNYCFYEASTQTTGNALTIPNITYTQADLATQVSFTPTSPMSPAQGNVGAAINQVLRDSVVAVKPSDQSVASSTALVNESALTVPMLATDTWEVRWRLYTTFASGAGIALAVTVPTGASLLWTALALGTPASGLSVGTSAVEATAGTAQNVLDGVGTGTDGIVDVVATVIGDNTHAGNIVLQFTQTGSSATGTIIKAGSSLRAHRVE